MLLITWQLTAPKNLVGLSVEGSLMVLHKMRYVDGVSKGATNQVIAKQRRVSLYSCCITNKVRYSSNGTQTVAKNALLLHIFVYFLLHALLLHILFVY